MGTDFFDGIVKTFSKTTKELGKTTKELGARAEQSIETQKIRGKISGEERTIEKLKADLGDIIYKRHAEGEGIDGGGLIDVIAGKGQVEDKKGVIGAGVFSFGNIAYVFKIVDEIKGDVA